MAHDKPNAPGNRPGITPIPEGVDPNLYYPTRQHAFTWAVATGHDYDTVAAYADYYARFEAEYDPEYYPGHIDAFKRFEKWRKQHG